MCRPGVFRPVGPTTGVSDERPTRDDITEGMTVTVVQEQENNEGEPLIGDVRQIVSEDNTQPGGVKVKLESGVVGRVKEIRPDEG